MVLKRDAIVQNLMGFVSKRVAPYKQLRDVTCVVQILTSPTGKISRRVLVEQAQACLHS